MPSRPVPYVILTSAWSGVSELGLPADSVVVGRLRLRREWVPRASECCDRARGSSHLAICPSTASTPGHVPGRETGANLGEDASRERQREVKVLVDGLRDGTLPPVKAEVAGSNPVRTAIVMSQDIPDGRTQ